MGAGKKALRIATLIAGVLILFLAICRIVKILDLNFSQALLSFYMM